MKKLCPKCKTEKDIDCFGLNKTKKYGRSSYCIPCNRIAQKESRIRRSEHRKKYNSLLRLLDPENVKKSAQKSYLKHREKRLEKQRIRDMNSGHVRTKLGVLKIFPYINSIDEEKEATHDI